MKFSWASAVQTQFCEQKEPVLLMRWDTVAWGHPGEEQKHMQSTNSLADIAHTDKIFKDKHFLQGGNLARLNVFISLSKWVDILGHLGTDVEALNCS